MEKTMNILRLISRILIGALFVFSGYVKAVDPLGFTYKIGDYLESFGLTFFSPLALTLAILVIAAEIVMGLCLLARVRMKIVSWCVLLFMLFFTILTFYIAVKGNVVKDCGCFGDAIILSNSATFFKNLVAMIFVVIIFVGRNKYEPVAKCVTEWIILIAFYVGSVGVELYCLRNLPIIDFMPYRVGKNIPQSMERPEGAQSDIYETTYFYSKDGKTQEFDGTNYPWNDSTWTFVDTKSVLIQKGYEPPIHDFEIKTTDGEDITYDVIYSENYTFLLTMQKIEKINIGSMDKINEIANYCMISDNFDFYAYTSSGYDAIEEFVTKYNALYPFCFGDETTIKTIVRSNPGLILIKDGNIIAKWSHRNIPSIEKINKIIETDYETIVADTKSKEKRATIILAIIALLIVVPLNFIKKKK